MLMKNETISAILFLPISVVLLINTYGGEICD
jgi:hypothetical protein